MSNTDSASIARADEFYESVVQELKQVNTSFQGAAVATAPVYGGYHRAAAVLSTFEISKIKPAGPAGEEIEDLLANSTLASEGVRPGEAKRERPQATQTEEELLKTLSAKATRWTLLPQIRRNVIEQLGTREVLLNALDANPQRPTDTLQQTLEAYLRNDAPPLASQNVEQIVCTAQVTEWFRGILDNLPDPEAIARQLEAKRLLQPFAKLVGEHFSGRETQLTTLREYVGVLPPDSVWVQIKRTFFNFDEKPPLMIIGPGGVGKSTLVSKFILEHAILPPPRRFPFAYIDFDRPGLLAEEPVTLLVEAVRQIGIQYPDVQQYSERVRRNWQDELAMIARQAQSTADDAPVATAKLSKEARSRFLRDFHNLLESMGLLDEPFLLVLDTFEEVQYRSQQYIKQLWDFLNEFQSIVARLRTVFSGRSELQGFTTEKVVLAELDAPAAKGFLTSEGIKPETLIDTIVEKIGGNPLSLRLAVQVFNLGGASEDFFSKLTMGRIQSELYTRILDHIHDKEVMKLAHPGLVLRRITPGLIFKVLAKPCGVEVKNPQEAEKLFDSLSEEITLVVPGSPTPAEPSALRHMPEVRRGMIALLREDQAQKEKVKAIQENAIAYYEPFDDPISRAEEIYHRLVLKQDPDLIAARWIDGVNTQLYNAIEELEPAQQAFLVARLDTDVSDNILAQARQADWEEITARRVRNYLRLGQSEQALVALEQRPQRLPGSPLFNLAAQAYVGQKRFADALNVINQGLNSSLPDETVFDLLVLSARVNFNLARRDEALDNLVAARALAMKINDPVRLVDATLEVVALSTSTEDPLRQELLPLIKSLSDEQLSSNPTLVRKAVQMFGRADDDLLKRAVRLVGFESASQTQRRSLARAVALWDLTLSGQAGVESGVLARMTRIPMRGEISDTWKVFMQTAPPKQVEDVVSLLLANHEMTDPVREALMSILTFEMGSETRDKSTEQVPTTSSLPDVAAQGTNAPALKLTPSDKQKLIYSLKSAFPSRSDLSDMLRYRLDLNLDSISLTDKFDGTLENVVDFAQGRGLLPQIIGAALDSSPGNLSLANFARPFAFTPDAVDDEERIEDLVRANPVLNIDQWRSALGEMVGRICQVEFRMNNELRAGTGFLTGPNTLLTTYDTVEPVITGKVPPEQLALRFDVRVFSGTIINAGTCYRLAKEDWLIASSGPASAVDAADGAGWLNYALLRLNGVPGREPVGGEKAEPEAPPRGWIHLSSGEEPAAADTLLILDWASDTGVRLIISKTGVKADETQNRFYYRLDKTPQATGAPCFNSNWQLVALHAGKRTTSRRSKDSVGISVAAIVASLQSLGINDVLGSDNFATTVLRGGRVFLDRQQLRQALRELIAPQGRRILIVNGPPGSGKTYTREYVYDVTFSTPNNRVIYVDLDAGIQEPADLVQAISLQMGHGLGTIPVIGDSSGPREALMLVKWLVSRLTTNRALKWWLILDGFEKPLQPDTRIVVEELMRRFAKEDLRLILLNYRFDLSLDLADQTIIENIEPISRADIEAFVIEQFQRRSEEFTPMTIAAIVDQVVAASDYKDSDQIYPNAMRLRILNRTISEISTPAPFTA